MEKLTERRNQALVLSVAHTDHAHSRNLCLISQYLSRWMDRWTDRQTQKTTYTVCSQARHDGIHLYTST